MTRADLCEAVHEEVGLTRQDCAALVERTLDLVVEALERGETVKLSGFGVFQVRAKRERMGRNPKTGEPAAIDPRRVIGFRASQVMKARVDRALATSRRAPLAKGPEAFRTISEAADELGVPQHVLRFWETKFSFIRPMKRAGGRRFYRPQDIVVLRRGAPPAARRGLHDQGRAEAASRAGRSALRRRRRCRAAAETPTAPAHDAPPGPLVLDDEARRRLAAALDALEAAKTRLDGLLGGD